MKELSKPEKLMTANGPVIALYSARIDLDDHIITVLLLQSTPCLLSLGKLVNEDGYSYKWSPESNPTIIDPQGNMVECEFAYNVPLITPAPSSKVPASGDGEQESEQAPSPGGPSASGDGELAQEDEAAGIPPVHRKPIDPQHYITHFPKDPRCPICAQCKMQRTRHARKTHGEPDEMPVPQKSADAITADHSILSS